MEIFELHTCDEMMASYKVLCALYPTLTEEAYRNELAFMVQHNYSQVVVKVDGIIAGVSGVWIGNKLWCGKYMEIDNIVVSEEARSMGIGKKLMDYLQLKAEELGCGMIALDSYTTNFEAHKFFYNQGFVPKGFHFVHLLKPDMVR